ncbi:MAG: hypothetical protein HZA04_10490 [Nitrospinae bacterium]|nr:hypothetical protein [Nitrospinota bacterium]
MPSNIGFNAQVGNIANGGTKDFKVLVGDSNLNQLYPFDATYGGEITVSANVGTLTRTAGSIGFQSGNTVKYQFPQSPSLPVNGAYTPVELAFTLSDDDSVNNTARACTITVSVTYKANPSVTTSSTATKTITGTLN